MTVVFEAMHFHRAMKHEGRLRSWAKRMLKIYFCCKVVIHVSPSECSHQQTCMWHLWNLRLFPSAEGYQTGNNNRFF